jgi:hypothetical protein
LPPAAFAAASTIDFAFAAAASGETEEGAGPFDGFSVEAGACCCACIAAGAHSKKQRAPRNIAMRCIFMFSSSRFGAAGASHAMAVRVNRLRPLSS